jgi:hypothetical protein
MSGSYCSSSNILFQIEYILTLLLNKRRFTNFYQSAVISFTNAVWYIFYLVSFIIHLLSNNRNHILISDNMTQPNPLRNMPCASTPNQCIFERLLQRPMNLIADILDCRIIPNNQRLAEVRLDTFSVVILGFGF